MIEIICVSVGLIVFILWMWYELKHPIDIDDEHDEAIKFRVKSSAKNHH